MVLLVYCAFCGLEVRYSFKRGLQLAWSRRIAIKLPSLLVPVATQSKLLLHTQQNCISCEGENGFVFLDILQSYHIDLCINAVFNICKLRTNINSTLNTHLVILCSFESIKFLFGLVVIYKGGFTNTPNDSFSCSVKKRRHTMHQPPLNSKCALHASHPRLASHVS